LYAAASFLDGKPGSSINSFIRLIDHMRDATRKNTLPELIDYVIQHCGLIQHYLAEKEGQDRIENLQELVNAATAFVAEEGLGQDAVALTPIEFNTSLPVEPLFDNQTTTNTSPVEMSPLAGFLAHASLESGDNQAQAGQDAVQLMTVHASKGLEFKVVFITGLEEGLFPHENSINEPKGLEEERRLMYVAITRARDRLYLSHTQSRMLHGQVRYNMPSRFLEELPKECLKLLTPKHSESRWGNVARQVNPSWGNASLGNDLPTAKTFSKTSVVVPSTKSNNDHGFYVGQNVFHPKFGEGRITGFEGNASDTRAQVNFARHGVKWLQLSIAKLTAI
jgi:DNA helicase-2/ATP-dependent DNA helicase PcrA